MRWTSFVDSPRFAVRRSRWSLLRPLKTNAMIPRRSWSVDFLAPSPDELPEFSFIQGIKIAGIKIERIYR